MSRRWGFGAMDGDFSTPHISGTAGAPCGHAAGQYSPAAGPGCQCMLFRPYESVGFSHGAPLPPQKLLPTGTCPFSGYKSRDGQSRRKGSALTGDPELGLSFTSRSCDFMVLFGGSTEVVSCSFPWLLLLCCPCSSRAARAHLHLDGRVLPCPSPATTQQGGLEERSQLWLQSGVLAVGMARAGHRPNSPWSRHAIGLRMRRAKGPVASLRRFPRTLARPDEQQRMLCKGCQKQTAQLPSAGLLQVANKR